MGFPQAALLPWSWLLYRVPCVHWLDAALRLIGLETDDLIHLIQPRTVILFIPLRIRSLLLDPLDSNTVDECSKSYATIDFRGTRCQHM
jgi:hypothetical protein